MRMTMGFIKVGLAGMLLVAAAAVGVTFAPTLHGQSVRNRPFSEIRTQILGGSSIGVSLRDVDQTDVAREKLSSAAGAVVAEVDRDSPAAEAGFRAGDVVLTFDGEKVRSARHLARLIEETPEGRTVAATVVRAGSSMDLKVAPEAHQPFAALGEGWRDFNFNFPQLRELPDRDWRVFGLPEGQAPRVIGPQGFGARRGQLGISVQDLSDQLREYFGAPAGGVLVASVEPDSPAADAGLRAGDVITRVGDRTVRTGSDVTRLIQATTGEVTITVIRDKKELTLKATVDPVEARTPRRIIR